MNLNSGDTSGPCQPGQNGAGGRTTDVTAADAGGSTSRLSPVVSLLIGIVAVTALTIAAWSWFSGGIVFQLVRADLPAAGKMQRLQQFFERSGGLAPLVYFVFVTVEVVVAPLPGLMLYAPGGVLFGGFSGGLLALAGNVAGAGLACCMTRSLSGGRLLSLVAPESRETVQQALERRGAWLIFLLRLNPLTSSDLVSYAAGFTRIPVWKVMLATLAGMAPLCFAQAFLAESLLTAIPELLYPLLAACAVYAVGVVAVIRRLVRQSRSLANDGSER